jgi:hypothetical protein
MGEKMSETKGIAIRLDKELFKKIESLNIPRNNLIQDAVSQYIYKKENTDIKEENIPDDVYNEVYNTLYNTEMLPLKKKIKHQEEIILLLKEQLNGISKDKTFLQNQVKKTLSLMEINLPLLTRIKNKISESKNK